MADMSPNAKTLSITLKCKNCSHKYPSPIFMTPYSTFSSATLSNNLSQCPSCGHKGGCDKEHFVARFEGGGFVGNNAL